MPGPLSSSPEAGTHNNSPAPGGHKGPLLNSPAPGGHKGLPSSSPQHGGHKGPLLNSPAHGMLRIPLNSSPAPGGLRIPLNSSPAPGGHKGLPSSSPQHGVVKVPWADNSPGMLPRRRHQWTPGHNSRPQRHGSNKGRKVINLLPRRTVAVAQVNRGDNQRKPPINGVSPLNNQHNKAVGLRLTHSRHLQPRQGVMRHGSNKGKVLDRGSKGLVQDRMKAPRQIGPYCAAVPESQEA
jgi:hypothetical protein